MVEAVGLAGLLTSGPLVRDPRGLLPFTRSVGPGINSSTTSAPHHLAFTRGLTLSTARHTKFTPPGPRATPPPAPPISTGSYSNAKTLGLARVPCAVRCGAPARTGKGTVDKLERLRFSYIRGLPRRDRRRWRRWQRFAAKGRRPCRHTLLYRRALHQRRSQRLPHR